MAKTKTKKKAKKKQAKSKKAKDRKIPVRQGKSKVGYKNPPQEHQFPPGVSGNPAGPPIAKTQLWRYFCKFMKMTRADIEKIDQDKLTVSEQVALTLALNAGLGKHSGSGKMARYVVDREEGKALERVQVTGAEPLSNDECEAIRDMLKSNVD